MSTIGIVARYPALKPAGMSLGSAGRRSGISEAADAIDSAAVSLPTTIAGAMRTPVLESLASSRNTCRERLVQASVSAARSAGRGGAQTAPATTDVVCFGCAADQTRTGHPASARHSAEVKPLTPAPTTSTCCDRCATAAECVRTGEPAERVEDRVEDPADSWKEPADWAEELAERHQAGSRGCPECPAPVL